jgi:hypothetical protein
MINYKFKTTPYKHQLDALQDSWDKENYIVNQKGVTSLFQTQSQISEKLGKKIFFDKLDIKEEIELEVNNFPTSCTPYNTVLDVKRRLPLFTKSNKSKSLYCAGYYIIKFDKGWVKSFCPKLMTLEKYEYKGPFKQKIEMREALSKANAKRTD